MRSSMFALVVASSAVGACVHDANEAPRVAPDETPAAEMLPPEGEGVEFVEDEPWRGDSPQHTEDEFWRGDDVPGRDGPADPDRPRWVIPVIGVADHPVRGTATVFEDGSKRLMVSLSLEGLPASARRARVFVAGGCASALPGDAADPEPGEPSAGDPRVLGRLDITGDTQKAYLLAELAPADASASELALLPTEVLVVRSDRPAGEGEVLACAPLETVELDASGRLSRARSTP